MFCKQEATAATTLLVILLSVPVLAQAPLDAETHFKQGEAFLESKELQKAVSEFKQAISKKPGWAEAYFKLGQAHSATPIEDPGFYATRKAALQAFQEAVRLKPDWAEAHYEVGRNLHVIHGNPQADAVIRSFKEALRLKPEFTDAHESLAIAYLYKQSFQQAINSLLTAVQLEPNRPLPHKLLGLAYLIVDQQGKAVAELEILKSLDTEGANYLKKAIESPTKPQFGLVRGELVKLPRPVYPDEARRRRILGTVTVEVNINEKGQVTAARATHGPVELHRAAESAARKAIFKPTTLSGHPVAVKGILSFSFRP